jgi:GTP pyrophosphokinase
VIDRNEITFEIQIRTEEMHKLAEHGIAAHWRYKEGISFIENDSRLKWFREMIDHHIANPNPQEFLNLVKNDLTPDEIYVFTPKGKIISLKSGATPIDFAYAIHTEIGNKCHRAIVNELLVPIRTRLKSGDVVEIQTSRHVSPSIDWLKYAGTHRAHKMITAYINKRENSILIAKGKRMWNRVFQKYQKKSGQREVVEDLSRRIRNLNYKKKDPFFKDLGAGIINLNAANLKKMFPRFTPAQIKPRKRPHTRNKTQSHRLVLVEGHSDIEVSLAKCCYPIKGDDIKGYITANRGLVIHKNNCSNLKNVIDSKIKQVTWNRDIESSYLIRYNIIIDDQVGALNKITTILTNHNSSIRDISIEEISSKNKRIKVVFEVSDLNQLNKIQEDLQNQKSIYSVVRKRITEK